MKCVILAGGYGTRMGEETELKPKPLIEIGGIPILVHILNSYSKHGINEFVICLGYKGYLIKEFFANYLLHMSDVTFDLKENKMEIHRKHVESWTITLVDTGLNTMTGGRLKRIQKFVDDDSFCFTYGDGLGNINISELVDFQKKQKTLATLTAVQIPGRFGALNLQENRVSSFKEKPKGDGEWINGGYFVLEPDIFDYIDGDSTIWEREPLERLARDNQLSAFRHLGFWCPLDTLYDKNYLNELWNSHKAPWKVW